MSPSQPPTGGARSPTRVARQKARNPFTWLRRLLLLLGVLCVGGLAVLLGAYRFGTATQPTSTPPQQPLEADVNAVTIGQGFDHTQTSGGRPVFRIRADRSRQDRDNTNLLEGVLLDIYREDGEIYQIRSDRAIFNQDGDWAELEGNVILSGWQDLELHTRALEVRQDGQLLTSDGEVQFFYPPNLSGRASRMRVDRRSELITFSGGVHLQSDPESDVEVRLDCERLAYRQGERVIRALDDVRLVHGRHELETRALTVFLGEDDSTVSAIRARWDVVGRIQTEADFGAEQTIIYRGDFLEMQPEEDGSEPRMVRLESAEGQPVELRASDPTGLVRQITGEFLVGHLHEGQLVMVESAGRPMEMIEALDVEPAFVLRRACADRGVARFLETGELGRLDLFGQVDLNAGDANISGAERANLDLVAGKIDARGTAVELLSDRGHIVAPVFNYNMESGLIRAESGVQATLEENSVSGLETSPLGRGEGPVRIESAKGIWTLEPPTFTFTGDVRAWRGQNLLLADQLRGDEDSRVLTASGKVKTVWLSDRLTQEGQPVPPIEVTAETLTFQEMDNLLIYDKKVSVVQGKQTLTCKTLDVLLGANNGSAERMVCKEDVELVDPSAGRRVLGERAVYTLAIDLVEVFGEPVRLIGEDSNKLEGRYLLYDVAAGTVQLRSRQPEETAPSP